jgi:cytochrome b6-f complex iron-sulfur subunit
MQNPPRLKLKRRTVLNYFLGTTLGGTLSAVLYPVLQFLVPPAVSEASQSNVVAGTSGDLRQGSGKIFKFGSQPALLIKTPTGETRAFSAICTHLNCTVQYRPDMGHIWCACHDGHYDINGKNIAGPPPRPLEQYVVNFRGDDIIVSKG